MKPLLLRLVNAPPIKRRRKSTTTTTNQAAKARRARARRRPPAPTTNGDTPMASKRRKKTTNTTTSTKRSTRRKRSGSTSRRYNSTPPAPKRRRRGGGGGGGGRGFFAKFMPANGLMVAAGGAGALLGAGYVVDFVAGYLPENIVNNQFFAPAAWTIVGGLGYWGLKRWSPGLALGFFVGAAAKAVYSIAQPIISDFVNGQMGLVSGGGYTPREALPGENERVALVPQTQARLAGMNTNQNFFNNRPVQRQNNALRLVA